jgi:hypothetical protein
VKLLTTCDSLRDDEARVRDQHELGENTVLVRSFNGMRRALHIALDNLSMCSTQTVCVA